ncbi:MAG: CPBP family intramembrane metalloprotease [bacterium]|nr:CPBP family intramembrane metalloprotease [bacterium]
MFQTKLYYLLFSYIVVFFLWYNLFVLHLIPFQAIIVIISVLLFLFSVPAFKHFIQHSKITFTGVFFGVLSAVFLYYTIRIGYLLLNQVLFENTMFLEFVTIVRNALTPNWWFIGVILLLSAAEEIFFRGYIQSFLMSKLGTKRGLLLTSTMYGILHIPTQNPILYFAAFITALVWGWIYSITKNIYIPIISHCTWIIMMFMFFPFDITSNHSFV